MNYDWLVFNRFYELAVNHDRISVIFCMNVTFYLINLCKIVLMNHGKKHFFDNLSCVYYKRVVVCLVGNVALVFYSIFSIAADFVGCS